MNGNKPFDFAGSKPVRLAIGAIAGALAIGLAFEVGQDAAALLFGGGDAAVTKPAPISAAKPAPSPAAPSPAAPSPADAPFVVKSILPIKDPIAFGKFYWQPERTTNGPLVITVDLTARVMSVFRDGHEIGTSAILKGYSAKPTPLGVFPILMMDADHHSSLYDDAPMPYTMRLTGDGVSIHGSKVEKGYATNGCVGIPTPFAKLVFAAAKVGDKVIITDGKSMKLGDPILAN
ncbi:L,D-transpeptidase family protein [Novosphingobium sp.]|uniref:L,D-transpeptidase family protein n=1 Tax=Novosphingobium sp. TaxID=1874826 RepID=UPI0025E43773|nr:L,D-transpeptidase family protein [Novosphingobium sp.]